MRKVADMTEQRSAVLVEQLREGVSELRSSERWAAYLSAQAKFHNYSFGNVMLIAHQNAEATQVAGFHRWLELGRHVVKGEKAIWILAPMVAKDKETGDAVVRGFKAVAVFDVAQTDGAELPEANSLLAGEDPAGVFAALSAYARSLGFEVVVDMRRTDGANGFCDHAERLIWVREDRSPAQQVKTLAHEIAHAILHQDRGALARDVVELEAESVAYVVCAALGIASDDYSFGYIAEWAGDQVDKALKASATRIQKTSDHILVALADLVAA